MGDIILGDCFITFHFNDLLGFGLGRFKKCVLVKPR